jgi:cytochrome c oxidase cbb3-type subunit II
MSFGVGKYEMDEMRLVVGSMIILSAATALLVVMPYLLLKDTKPPPGLKPYTDVQLQGRQVYIANGCLYCHSQQPRDIAQAPDALRGWGRASIAADYAYDTPHLLGTMRTGPDLLNIGARQPSRDWHLGHLYAPRAYTPGSTMPAYPYMFEVRQGAAQPGDVVVNLPPAFAKPGQVVVAKPEALALVEYLISLDRTYPALKAEDDQAVDRKAIRRGPAPGLRNPTSTPANSRPCAARSPTPTRRCTRCPGSSSCSSVRWACGVRSTSPARLRARPRPTATSVP